MSIALFMNGGLKGEIFLVITHMSHLLWETDIV